MIWTTPLHPASKLRISGAIPLCSLYALMIRTEKNLPSFTNLLLQIYLLCKESDCICSVFYGIFLKNIPNEGISMMKHTSYNIHMFHVWWVVLRKSASSKFHIKSKWNCTDRNQTHIGQKIFSANHRYEIELKCI